MAGCNCNSNNFGNCGCSEPITLISCPAGATGATGATGAQGAAVLHNDMSNALQGGSGSTTSYTYAATGTNLLDTNGSAYMLSGMIRLVNMKPDELNPDYLKIYVGGTTMCMVRIPEVSVRDAVVYFEGFVNRIAENAVGNTLCNMRFFIVPKNSDARIVTMSPGYAGLAMNTLQNNWAAATNITLELTINSVVTSPTANCVYMVQWMITKFKKA